MYWLARMIEGGEDVKFIARRMMRALLTLAICVTAVFVRRRSQMFPLVAATATLCVALHGLVDFSLQIPAVAVTFAAILGMGAAQSQRSEINKARSRGGQPAVPYREPATGGVSPAPA